MNYGLQMDYELPIMGLDDFFRNVFGVNQITAEIMCVLLILALFFVPTFFLKTSNYLTMVLTILVVAPLTAIGWLPFYTWILLTLYLAITVSGKMKGWF